MRRGVVLFWVWLVAAEGGTAAQKSIVAPLAEPVEPTAALLRAFEAHQIVALADSPHGSEQLHAFRMSLVRDPQFARVVNDIVVEFGNARYQGEMDRFVRGGDVPQNELQKVWQDTTQVSAVWDRAIYEDFYRAVRDVNLTLPSERQIRVLLGDPPVDWARRPEDIGTWTRQRTEHAAKVVLTEVLAKHRRALVIYGGAHLARTRQSLVGRIESAGPTSVLTATNLSGATLARVLNVQPSVAAWRTPSLATLAGTRLYQQDLVYYDAALYLGPSTSLSRIPRGLCADHRYVAKRLERLALIGPGADRTFRAECAIQ